ncbi:MAG: hypothetical protein ACR2HG_01130 [Pyrinomonadaceae bacterium]
MKNLMIKFAFALVVLTMSFVYVSAQEAATNSETEAAAGLDLYAVAEIFKDSETLEKFEQNLNNSANGINNLDLNEDGEIDFIRVSEQVAGKTHFAVLQITLGEDDFQDVATIAVEEENAGNYNLQFQGDAAIYGANYYVVPANNNFGGWNIVRWLFSPNYRVYVSPYGYQNYPRWWTIRRPVADNIYRTRTNVFVGRRNFAVSKTVKVKTVSKINYRPRTSSSAKTKTKVTRVSKTTTDSTNGNRVKNTKIKVVIRKKKLNP